MYIELFFVKLLSGVVNVAEFDVESSGQELLLRLSAKSKSLALEAPTLGLPAGAPASWGHATGGVVGPRIFHRDGGIGHRRGQVQIAAAVWCIAWCLRS